MSKLKAFIAKSSAAAATATAFLMQAPKVLAQDFSNIGNNLRAVGSEAFGQGVAAQGANALPQTIGRLINAALSLLGIVMVVLFIYAGYLYLTSGGEEKKAGEAKILMKNAVIGAVLIFLAYAISAFVINAIAGSMMTGVTTGL